MPYFHSFFKHLSYLTFNRHFIFLRQFLFSSLWYRVAVGGGLVVFGALHPTSTFSFFNATSLLAMHLCRRPARSRAFVNRRGERGLVIGKQGEGQGREVSQVAGVSTDCGAVTLVRGNRTSSLQSAPITDSTVSFVVLIKERDFFFFFGLCLFLEKLPWIFLNPSFSLDVGNMFVNLFT